MEGQKSLLSNGEINQKVDDEQSRLSRLASIGQLSAGIAHEVRNPLTAVKGFLQLLQKENEHQYLDIALSELNSGLDTLNNLLQVSKPDLDDEPFVNLNICSELESTISLFQDQIYRVSFNTNMKNTKTNIRGQRNALKKVFFNLLKNALEAIPEKGKISIEHYMHGESLYIKIEDTGTGIPKDKLELLGTPFFSTKDTGTGMGLTQVFTTLHKHGAKVHVDSEEKVGTTFSIIFPINNSNDIRVVKMTDLVFLEGQSFIGFIDENKEKFNNLLHGRMEGIFGQVEDSTYNEERLFDIAYKIVKFLNDDAEHELIILAKEHGIAWAKSDLPIILNLEWFQGLRGVYWDFLYNYYKNLEVSTEMFFDLEKKTNYYLDTFLKHYHISFNEYKNQVLYSQREVIEELSVPIIPLSNKIGILPLIGTVDTYRAKKLQEKVLAEITENRFRRVIIDLSGVAYMDTAVVGHLFKIIDGFKLLGCQAIVSGIRSEVANTMIELGVTFDDKIPTYADLQQALEEITVYKKPEVIS